MHKYRLIISIGSLITVHALAMNKVPSLQTITANNIATGYGVTNNNRQKNSAALITTLQKSIDECKKKHVGKYGWTINTGSGEEFFGKENYTAFIPKLGIKKSYQLHTPFLIKTHYAKNLYIIGEGNNLCTFNIKSNNKQTTLSGHTKPITCCTTVPGNDHIILSGSEDTTIKIWNISNNTLLHNVTGHHCASVKHLAAEDNIFCSTDEIDHMNIGDLGSGICYYIKLLPQYSSPESLMLNNRMVYLAHDGGSIEVIDCRLDKSVCKWDAHKYNAINYIVASKQHAELIYSAANDKTIKQWDMRNLTACVKTMQTIQHPAYAHRAEFNIKNIYEDIEGKKIFASDKERIYVWDVTQEKPKLCTKNYLGCTIKIDNTHSMVMNDDETKLYLATTDGIKTITPNCTYEDLAALSKK
ncbi:MAG TPA: hypothetical protein VLB80_00410 [Candidatus Babeliales bacterium]|nr:hypothetical protein [Candidatus Babeliales bacterium]